MSIEYYAIRHSSLGYYNGEEEMFSPKEKKSPRLYRTIKDARIQIEYLSRRGFDQWEMRPVPVTVTF